MYCRIPLSSPSAAFFIASLISSLVVSFSKIHVKSTMDTSGVGVLNAMPFILPAHGGNTSPIAFAAPVLVGIIFIAAARARLGSLW